MLYYASPLWFTAMIPLAVLYSVTCNWVWKPPMVPLLLPASPPHGLAIVTGANTGIGFEAARRLAIDYQYEVILACRSTTKGQAAAQAILKEFPQAQVRVMPLDLSDLDSIRSFVQEFSSNNNNQSIAVLINNAGRNTDPTTTTTNKWNVLFQTNFVGHFYLTQLLLQQQAFVSNQARLVQVSSVMHHFAPYEDQWTEPEFWKQVASSASSEIRDRYSLSKLAAIFLSIQLNRLYGDRLQSIAVNPGAVNSDIWRDYPDWIRKLFSYIYLTSEQGAETLVAAAVGDFRSANEKETLYLQPYGQCFGSSGQVPFPAFEMLGPFVGHVVTHPRLRLQDYEKAAEALWTAMEELLHLDETKKEEDSIISSSLNQIDEL